MQTSDGTFIYLCAMRCVYVIKLQKVRCMYMCKIDGFSQKFMDLFF